MARISIINERMSCKPTAKAVGYILSPLRVFLWILLFATFGNAQWHVTGVGGTWTRLQAPDNLNFTDFRSGPSSTTSPVIGFEGGRAIWKVTVDGTFLTTTTGETDTVIGPSRQISQTTTGHAIYLDGGGEWPLLHFRGFGISARGGYGLARVSIPTEVPIDDHQRFWTYGFTGWRNIGSRYLLRIDLRNAHFRREEIPETLGRFNIVALGGFGLKF